MAANLVASIMQSLTPEIISKVALMLGLDPNIVQKGIGAIVPSILASFTNLASNPDGGRQLASALSQQPPDGADLLKNALGDPSQMTKLAGSGAGMLSSLVGGSGLNALTSVVSRFAGMSPDAGKLLVGLVGPVVMSGIGQQQRGANLDSGALASLLNSQKDQISAAMPSGLADMLGSTGLLGPVSRLKDVSMNAANDAAQASYSAARRASSPRWLYWAAGLAVLLGAGWYFMGNPGDRKVAEQEPGSVARSTETVGVGHAANESATDLARELISSVNTVKTALQGITDSASAQAALPKLQQATTQLERVNQLRARLPINANQQLVSTVTASMPVLNQLCDKVMSMPGAANVAKPAINALRGKLDALSRA